jgi:hypothetical protein
VTERVVDLLEPVEVDQHHREVPMTGGGSLLGGLDETHGGFPDR